MILVSYQSRTTKPVGLQRHWDFPEKICLLLYEGRLGPIPPVPLGPTQGGGVQLFHLLPHPWSISGGSGWP